MDITLEKVLEAYWITGLKPCSKETFDPEKNRGCVLTALCLVETCQSVEEAKKLYLPGATVLGYFQDYYPKWDSLGWAVDFDRGFDGYDPAYREGSGFDIGKAIREGALDAYLAGKKGKPKRVKSDPIEFPRPEKEPVKEPTKKPEKVPA